MLTRALLAAALAIMSFTMIFPADRPITPAGKAGRSIGVSSQRFVARPRTMSASVKRGPTAKLPVRWSCSSRMLICRFQLRRLAEMAAASVCSGLCRTSAMNA